MLAFSARSWVSVTTQVMRVPAIQPHAIGMENVPLL